MPYQQGLDRLFINNFNKLFVYLLLRLWLPSAHEYSCSFKTSMALKDNSHRHLLERILIHKFY